MTTVQKQPRTIVPPSFFASIVLPFFVPFALTLILIAFVGESWPRNLVPGSGLKLIGLVATALTGLLSWKIAVRGLNDIRAHKAAALLVTITGLMGWPVWTVGFLPSINGIHVEDQQTVSMILERTETTTVSRSRKRNHWAWLRPINPGSLAGSGRYFITEETYARWELEEPREVELIVGQGILGAQVVSRAN